MSGSAGLTVTAVLSALLIAAACSSGQGYPATTPGVVSFARGCAVHTVAAPRTILPACGEVTRLR